MGVVATSRAMELAMESDLDLVEIVPHADPPVCRLMNFGKFLFDLNKKKHAAKKKQKQVQVKEIKFRPAIDESDYQIKLRSLRKFLDNGDKVRLACTISGFNLSNDSLNSFSALGEGIV